MNQRLIELGIKAAVGAVAALGLKAALDRGERSAVIQRAFDRFHERIRHEQFGERDLLRERRDTLESRLSNMLNPELRPRLFHQGSYALYTGVKPLSGEFDIDVGLVIQGRRNDFNSPIEVKQVVHDALKQGRRQVRIRRSCVTVDYADRTYGAHHVDIAVYVQEPDGRMFIAKGKRHSEPNLVLWERADPEELTTRLNSKFKSEELAQYRRCIRYLKRWKHRNFATQAPYSIALTVAAYHWFQPKTRGFWGNVPDDLEALLTLSQNMLDAVERGRLRVAVPVEPHPDLMTRLNGAQMTNFLTQLDALRQGLIAAREEKDFETGVVCLQKLFGAEIG